MRDEQNAIVGDADAIPYAVLHPELVEQPRGHRLSEDRARAGRRGKHRRQDALELDERLFEEDHAIEIPAAQASFTETEANGAIGKVEIVLDAREALLFGGRNEQAVAHERSGGVVEVTGDAEDVHQNCRRADVRSSPLSLRARQPSEPSSARLAPNIWPTAATGTTTYMRNRSTCDCTTAAR